MPANLTPEYEKAELRPRQAGTDLERVAALQEKLAAIPKRKGTGKLQADLKRHLSHVWKADQPSGYTKGPDPFHIPKSGAGQVVIIGPPDLHKPFVIPLGATVADLALQVHCDLPERMKFARLWGHSRFEGQQVHKTEILRDRDVVEIHE
ncbi:MAG: TGS domain-containing protein [Verrucomicrobiota bacterium]|jgi:ribosome-interacting GTPase 1